MRCDAWKLLSRLFFLTLALALTLPTTGYHSDVWAQSLDSKKAFEMYRRVMEGELKFEDLTADEQRTILDVHRILRNTAPSDASEVCSDAHDRASSASDDLSSAAGRLKSCAESRNFDDDCSSEMRRARNAHSDYESAVSDVSSECD